MARRSSYCPIEDDIIMSSSGPADAHRRLIAAGFAERTVGAVGQRRFYLKKHGVPSDQRIEKASLQELTSLYGSVEDQVGRLDELAQITRNKRQRIVKRIRDEADRLASVD